jgi:SAM-dependent methyltransferase
MRKLDLAHDMVLAMEKLEQALCSHRGPSILRTLSRFGMGDAPDQQDLPVLPVLVELGLGRQTRTGFSLDGFGRKCADAAREYMLWTARGRQLHFESSLPALTLSNFESKRVLEIGPGWGCNLFRLQQVTPHARGREIDEFYVRFTSIFARLEGVEPPEIDVGAGEELPYADGSFDWVLLFSALQYMDITAAVREIARVLAPGGKVLTMQPLLPVLLADLTGGPRPLHSLAYRTLTLVNSLFYGLFGRRLRGNLASTSTARPVYLTRHRIIAIVENTGLNFLPTQSSQQGRGFILVAEKPRGHGSGASAS